MSDEDRAERRRRERADRKAQHAKEQDELAIEREWEINPDWKTYVLHIQQNVAPMMWDANMNISIIPERPQDVDVKLAVELGMGLMFDKPLILLVPSANTVIPEHLRRAADHIVIGMPNEPGVKEAMFEAISAVRKELGDDE